jgi:hypothetical protein
MYSVVTGFFPETSPKETWASDPRPLLICGTAKNPETGVFLCRTIYGTSQHLELAKPDDLVVGNLSLLNDLCLKKPTRFVLHSGKQMAIIPWTNEFFRPWSDRRTPVRSILPQDMQRHVAFVLSKLKDLPQF